MSLISRVRAFRESAPGSTLPPEPVITRWGTWISVASYYATNFDEIKRVSFEFDRNEAAAIGKCQELLQEPSLKSQLVFVASNFLMLPNSMESLECTKQSLTTTIEIFVDARKLTDAAEGATRELIKDKLKRVIQQNAGYGTMCHFQQALQGSEMTAELTNFSPSDLSSFKYAFS